MCFKITHLGFAVIVTISKFKDKSVVMWSQILTAYVQLGQN